MKNRIVKPLTLGAGLVGCCLTLLLMANSNQAAHGVFGKLSGVSVMELPYVAAQIVKKAPAADRSAVAQEVVRAAVSLSKPGMVPFVVSSICQAAPDVAVEVVNTAVALQPNQMLAIGKAALTATPSNVQGIVAALCKSENRAFADVAVMAAGELPNASENILAGVAAGVPELAQSLSQVRVYSATQPMADVMKKAGELAKASGLTEVAYNSSALSSVKTAGQSLGAVELARTATTANQSQSLNQTKTFTVASVGPNVFQPGTSLFDPPPPQAPPTLGAPFTPYSGSSTEFKAGNGTVLPPGSDRPLSYSSP